MRKYKVGDLRESIRRNKKRYQEQRSILEDKNEFNPVVGNKDNKKINKEYYKSASSVAKDYDGGLGKVKKGEVATPEMNQGMSDIRYDLTNDEFNKNQISRMKGYVSKQAEDLHKNDDFGNADFGEPFYIKAHAKDSKKIKDDIKNQSNVVKHDKDNVSGDDVFESKKIKKLNFKRTKFLSENHMLSKIPDNYKVEGNRFIMNDSDGTSYLVEWSNVEKPVVEKRLSKKIVAEEVNRIKSLFSYDYSKRNQRSTVDSRLEEEKCFGSVLDKARKITK